MMLSLRRTLVLYIFKRHEGLKFFVAQVANVSNMMTNVPNAQVSDTTGDDQ